MSEKRLELLSTFKMLEESDELIIEGLANAQTVDRTGDIVLQEAYNKGGIQNYLKNPIILFNHDYGKPIGKAVQITVDNKGLSIKAKISKAAGDVYSLIKEGIISAFSIGFIVKDAIYDQDVDVFEIKNIELLEVSVVAVPANQDSIFNIAKQFETKEEYVEFKKQFAPDSATIDSAPQAPNEENKMDEEMKKEIEKLKAELKAAESIIDEAAQKEKAQKEEAQKESFKVEVKSQVEDLLKEVEKRFEEKEGSLKSAISGLEAELKEKSEEIQRITRSKMTFNDTASNENISVKDRDNAVLISKLLGKDIQNTRFFNDLKQKAGAHVPTASGTNDWEIEFNNRIFQEMKDKLVIEPLFNTIQMSAPVQHISSNPEAEYAAWVATSGSTGTAATHQLNSRTLTAYKLASKEYINYEEEEDTILPIVPIIRDAVVRRMAKASDEALLRGDATVATGRGDTYPFDGLLAIAVDATKNATSVLTSAKWTVDNLQAVRRQLGKFGLNPGEIVYLVSQDVYYDLLEDPDFRTIDMVGNQATILKGQIGFVNGSVVIVSDSFKAKAINTQCVAAVYTGNFYVGNLRGMMVERDVNIEEQKRIIVATRRMGFVGIQATGGVAEGVATGTWGAS